MEVLGPERIICREPSCEIFDVVLLAVPFSTGCQKFMDRVVLLDVSTLDIHTDIIHPTLAAFLHLLNDDAL